jgi:hypothetical protein
LVTEVDTGFQHFTHCYGHVILQGWVWNPASHLKGTLCGRIRDLTSILTTLLKTEFKQPEILAAFGVFFKWNEHPVAAIPAVPAPNMPPRYHL